MNDGKIVNVVLIHALCKRDSFGISCKNKFDNFIHVDVKLLPECKWNSLELTSCVVDLYGGFAGMNYQKMCA